jgi:hypothetical protein
MHADLFYQKVDAVLVLVSVSSMGFPSGARQAQTLSSLLVLMV